MNTVDADVQEGAGLPILWPLTQRCKNWLEDHFPDERDYNGDSLVIESPRMKGAVQRLRDAGMVVETYDGFPND